LEEEKGEKGEGSVRGKGEALVNVIYLFISLLPHIIPTGRGRGKKKKLKGKKILGYYLLPYLLTNHRKEREKTGKEKKKKKRQTVSAWLSIYLSLSSLHVAGRGKRKKKERRVGGEAGSFLIGSGRKRRKKKIQKGGAAACFPSRGERKGKGVRREG